MSASGQSSRARRGGSFFQQTVEESMSSPLNKKCNNDDLDLIESIKRFYMEQDSLLFFNPRTINRMG